ncbi:MAG: helix-turn-helix transcriptional regulator, partial [Bacteroidaceae bacterium]|nr:helix-turn-helix transcriptional regulator [Bacteroidaceae bacterium]
AIPLLHSSGNLHSWGICQNQLGDILASEGKDEEAAARYLEAARLFLGQGDMYNELHAREGLYKAMKGGDPGKAMLHLERAKMLKDSIYRSETAEALAKYNAIYYNDILQEQNEHIVRRNRTVLRAGGIFFALLLALVAIAVFVTYRRHRRKVKDYEQNISSLQEMYTGLLLKYQNVDAYTTQESAGLTDDDKLFLSQLASVIYAVTEKGHSDIQTIVRQMGINVSTLRRRLAQTLSVTPKTYILRMRLQKAMSMLQSHRDINVAEVAYKCGYSQVPNFSRAFTNFFGITPTEVKTRTRKE